MEKLSSLSAAFPAVIAVCGAFYIFKLRAFFIMHPIKTVRRMFSDASQIRELSLSLAGTLGVGNIVGVAMAISVGGAGAVFWMWASAFLSMALKYAEISLAVKYREFTPDGKIRGGPMYYMKNGVGGKFGKALAALFAALAVLLSVVMGNIVQVRAAVGAVFCIAKIPPVFIGIALAALCAVSVFGGYGVCSRATAVIVPIMSGVYVAMAAKIVISNIGALGGVMEKIFSSAFEPSAAGGGALGFLFGAALRNGFAKGAYSHEAGGGTAPLSHAQTKTKSPARQGLLGLFEVFFDTVLICTLTSFVIILYGGDEVGSELVFCAFSHFFGSAGGYLLSVSVFMFAFSTLICWGYYGRTCLEYMTKSRAAVMIYSALYCAVAVIGALIDEGRAWILTDVGVALMTSVNLIAVVFLWRDVKRETEIYGLITPRRR